jgi:hypothetical protein
MLSRPRPRNSLKIGHVRFLRIRTSQFIHHNKCMTKQDPLLPLSLCPDILNELRCFFTLRNKVSRGGSISPVLSSHIPLLLFNCWIVAASILKFLLANKIGLITFVQITHFRVYIRIICQTIITDLKKSPFRYLNLIFNLPVTFS